MRDLSAPTRKRLAALGAVRYRSSSRSGGALADLEHGGDDVLSSGEMVSGEVPPLRAQYGSGSPQASGEVDDGGDTFDAGAVELTSGGLQQHQGVRGWEGLDDQPVLGSRSGSVRFSRHVRSESGSQYPLH